MLLSVSTPVEMQWQVYPTDLNTSVTSSSHLLPRGVWAHVAVTDGGSMTRMHVDACEVVRNPTSSARGIASLELPWPLGAHVDGGGVSVGWIGDVRIVDRALEPRELLTARCRAGRPDRGAGSRLSISTSGATTAIAASQAGPANATWSRCEAGGR